MEEKKCFENRCDHHGKCGLQKPDFSLKKIGVIFVKENKDWNMHNSAI